MLAETAVGPVGAAVSVMFGCSGADLDEFDIEFPERFLKRATFESIGNLRGALDELLGADA